MQSAVQSRTRARARALFTSVVASRVTSPSLRTTSKKKRVLCSHSCTSYDILYGQRPYAALYGSTVPRAFFGGVPPEALRCVRSRRR